MILRNARCNNEDAECVFVALVIKHAEGMRRVMSSSVACLALQCFIRHVLLTAKKCGGKFAAICSANCVSDISDSKKTSARYHHKCASVFKCRFFLSDNNETCIF